MAALEISTLVTRTPSDAAEHCGRVRVVSRQLSSIRLASLFDTGAYAATTAERVQRAVELGPRYYLRDVPRYVLQRRRLGLPPLDWGVLRSPTRSFRARAYLPGTPPPNLHEAYELLNEAGVRFDNPQLRTEALAARWWSARGASGDVIECGAFRGATSLLLAVLGRLNGLQQTVLMLDTFAGMPAPSVFDSSRREGEYSAPKGWPERLRELARTLGVADRVEVHPGLFTDTFRELTASQRFAFVHIDANIYEGTLDACKFCLPRIAEGGVVVFDDYNGLCDLGARLAIDQALHPLGLTPSPLAECSAYLQF